VRVASEKFEQQGNQWLPELFDFKEHAAALSLAFMIGAALVGRSVSRDDSLSKAEKTSVVRGVAALSVTGAAFVWAALLIGLYITAHQPVGHP
jgi:hypothetical protein